VTPILLARPRLVAPPPTYQLPVGWRVELDVRAFDTTSLEVFAFAAGWEWSTSEPAVVALSDVDADGGLSRIATGVTPGVALITVEVFRAGDLLSLVARLVIDTRPPAVPVEIRAGLPRRIRRAP
jgi:hypothetical protein